MSDEKKMDEIIDGDALDAVQAAAESENVNRYVHVFSEPFTYEGKTYDSLKFDFDKLRGKDMLDIEHELQIMSRIVVAAEFSADFRVRTAAKACTLPIGIDLLLALPAKDYRAIDGKAKSFLVRSA